MMEDILSSDQKFVWHPFTPLQGVLPPIPIVSAEGVYLHTDDGRKIIDAVSSWWVNLHGHSHPYLAEAISKQARTLEHVIFAGFTHQPAVTLARNLLTILPSNQSKIFFSDNGSTAVEVGLKMAFQFWYNQGIEKKKVIALKGAYHGDTVGSMSVGDRSMFTDPFNTYLFETSFIDFPDNDNVKNVLDEFESLVRSGDVGAFIYEPLVQGAGGMRMYSAHVLDALIAMAHQYNVVCIADEVFTGFGRTGKLFASEYGEHKPDIMAISKGITGGMLPLGVTACSERIVNAYQTDKFSKTFFHGHSYTANPIACAAANASFELLMKPDCQLRIKRISDRHIQFTEQVKAHRAVSEVRSLGTILALEVKSSDETGYENTLRKKIYPFFMDRNILLRPLGNVIYVLPPYVISDDELDIIYAAIREFLDALIA